MLKAIAARDFAVIDQVELDLHAGLTALTGETGAGKSLLIDALMLCLGGRASTEWIRQGADKLDVSATFDLNHNAKARHWLAEQELLDDSLEVQLRRVIGQDGRSKAFINGTAQPLGQVRALGSLLCEIHGQQEFLSLMNAESQREIIDQLGVNIQTLDAVKSAAQQLNQLDQDIAELKRVANDRESRLLWLHHQIEELEAFGPKALEEPELRQWVQRQSHHRKLLEGMTQANAMLSEGDGQDILTLLAKTQNILRPLSEWDGRLQSVQTQLQEASLLLTDSSRVLSDCLSQDDWDPLQLEQKHNRLALYEQLSRKHRVNADELVTVLEQLKLEHKQLTHAEDTLSGWQLKRDELYKQYVRHALQLSEERLAIATRLTEQMTALLTELGMPQGRVVVAVTAQADHPIKPHGIDIIEFLVSANPGMALKPVAKVASGGELSRISLAIQVAGAHAKQNQWAMVFDEVDAGVGGAVAEMVGRELKKLSLNTQVLCVTHLPQVAAQANQHILVEKTQSRDHTQTRLKVLNDSERVDEIARMLAGVKITDSARKHAEQLLNDAVTHSPRASKTAPTSQTTKTRTAKLAKPKAQSSR